MTIRYNLELEDWIRFNQIQFKKRYWTRRNFKVIWLGFSLLFLIFAIVAALTISSVPLIVFCLIVSVFWLALIPRIDEFAVRKSLIKALNKEDKGYWLGPQELTLSSEAIKGKNEASEAAYKWKTVSSIETTEEYTIIYVTAISAIVIPRREFTENNTLDDFVRLAQKYWHDSKTT